MRGVLAVLLCLAAAHSYAQPKEDGRAPADPVSCLKVNIASRDQPSFDYRGNRGGRVRVQAEFTGPDAAPKVTILETSGDAALDAAVQAYVARYRLPCMQERDAPMRVVQTFTFDSVDSTTFGTPLRASDRADQLRVACVVRADNAKEPDYPDHRILGSVLVDAVFRSPDSEPVLTIVAGAPSQQLNDSALAFMRGYRMPCVGSEPVHAWQLFRFRGATRSLDTTVSAYLKLARGGREPPAAFDLDSMDCPFRVVLRYWEPVRHNEARVLVTGTQPSQKPFIDWLASLRLESGLAENLLLGDDVNIRVGCGQIGP